MNLIVNILILGAIIYVVVVFHKVIIYTFKSVFSFASGESDAKKGITALNKSSFHTCKIKFETFSNKQDKEFAEQAEKLASVSGSTVKEASDALLKALGRFKEETIEDACESAVSKEDIMM